MPELQQPGQGKRRFPETLTQLLAPRGPCDQVALGPAARKALQEPGCPPELLLPLAAVRVPGSNQVSHPAGDLKKDET